LILAKVRNFFFLFHMSTFAQDYRCVTHETSFLTQEIAIDSLAVGHCCGFTNISDG